MPTLTEFVDTIRSKDAAWVVSVVEGHGEVTCVVKDVPHVGFEGGFVTNLALPDHLAVGRSVSHGFGWFTRASPDAQ